MPACLTSASEFANLVGGTARGRATGWRSWRRSASPRSHGRRRARPRAAGRPPPTCARPVEGPRRRSGQDSGALSRPRRSSRMRPSGATTTVALKKPALGPSTGVRGAATVNRTSVQRTSCRLPGRRPTARQGSARSRGRSGRSPPARLERRRRPAVRNALHEPPRRFGRRRRRAQCELEQIDVARLVRVRQLRDEPPLERGGERRQRGDFEQAPRSRSASDSGR